MRQVARILAIKSAVWQVDVLLIFSQCIYFLKAPEFGEESGQMRGIILNICYFLSCIKFAVKI